MASAIGLRSFLDHKSLFTVVYLYYIYNLYICGVTKGELKPENTKPQYNSSSQSFSTLMSTIEFNRRPWFRPKSALSGAYIYI